ncbi:hypothetical protein [Photobacterium lutimaris]|uniref:Uncharacterized protein n=1 Tax=Photobacterium lutimaris TaxID=388278 RepID=A0A2T3ITN6_9GAMM|nr:hypothetical protein [Photobacterium lutimaris]PSU31729.1 hypothetical protein C9I99_21320 [Photobacterium lutimaris]TDR72631.1 hypothetical protein DFP78_113107 [Photobacterium lutimaris]
MQLSINGTSKRDLWIFTVGLAIACFIQIIFATSGFQGIFTEPYLIAIALVLAIRPANALFYGAFFAMAFFVALFFKILASDLAPTSLNIQVSVTGLIATYCLSMKFIKEMRMRYFSAVPVIVLGSVAVLSALKNVFQQFSAM